MKRFVIPLVLCFLALPLFAQFQWPQWALNPQHTGEASTVRAQELNQNLVNIIYDPLVTDEMNTVAPLYGEPVLVVHYQAPLVDGNDVFMMCKSGQYTKNSYATQRWGEMKLSWQNGTLAEVWDFESDWVAPGNQNDFWEPVFHPALANGFIYIPGAGGTIFKVSKASGAPVTRINPFATLDQQNVFTASPITVDPAGNLYYNVVQLVPSSDFYARDIVDSWLIKVSPSDAIQKVSYSQLTVGAPKGTDLCLATFSTTQLPWPPSPDAVPPSVQCGTQRPGLNVAPAIAPDGTIYVATRAHLISRWTYLVAINPDLTQKWISSLRNRFNDGCGVPIDQGGTLPPNGAPGGCRDGALYGVDPATNTPGGGRVLDDQSSTPVVAPDGTIIFGAYSRYNYAQGHLMRFAPNGQFLGKYNFGWDVTPGIYNHGGTYSILIKENRYGEVGSYCNDPTWCPEAPNSDLGRAYREAYYITRLAPDFSVEWRFQNTNTLSCQRNADGSISCVSDHPNGFEWCVNAFVIDKFGTVFANSEDGNLFAINKDGTLRKKIFQQLALGAAYTPTSIGGDGKIYSQNAGHLFVAGD